MLTKVECSQINTFKNNLINDPALVYASAATINYGLLLILKLLFFFTHRRRGGRVSPCQSPKCCLL